VRKVIQVGTVFAFEEDKWKEMQIVTAVLPGRQQFGMCKFCQQIHVGMENLASRHLLFGGMKMKSKINNST